MATTDPDKAALAQLFSQVDLSFSQVRDALGSLRTGLSLGRVQPPTGVLEAGNTACDSGCDSSCGGTLISTENVRAIGKARLDAIFDSRKIAGIERIGLPGGGLEAGNDACDSGCDSGCAGGLTRVGTVGQPT